jgi:alginate O-acetyltransferase complex protein AlgI
MVGGDMLFASFPFFLFLPAVFFVFLLTPIKFRWGVLLIASLGFYAVQGAPYLFFILVFVILASYVFGLWLDAANSENQKKWLLAAGITLLIAPLLSLRYLPVLLAYFSFHGGIAETQRLWITIGVSFYSFQAISYLIDIFLGILSPEKHLGYFALYLSFFPKLIQGPIERGGDLLPQIRQPSPLYYKTVMGGLMLIVWGLFLKLVLADRLGLFVDPVYNNLHEYSGLPLIIATYLYALQIYFDFSGYTLIAIGIARLFGFNLTNNFNSPYLATSIADFWRRWHISFSRWILDYIFKPLQMQWRNWKNWGSAAALIITFLVSGLWHGASWGYLIWGVLHGIFMAIAVFTAPLERKLLKKYKLTKSKWVRIGQIFLTFNLVCFCWIFFRANSLSDSGYIASHLFSSNAYNGDFNFINHSLLLNQGPKNGMIMLGLLLFVALVSVYKNQLADFVTHPFLDFVWKMRGRLSIQVVVWGLIAVTFGMLILTAGGSSFIYTVF